MRGMILAAGRGQRMGKLTENTPKPLLRVNDKYLIEFALDAFRRAGIVDIVINVSYLRHQIKAALGNGQAFGVNIEYSEEVEALETGGGIFQALPLLGDQPFVVMSADILSAFDLSSLPKKLSGLAHLVLVDNPSFKETGDFNLENGCVNTLTPCQLTYANIGVLHPELFRECKPGKYGLGPLLKSHAAAGLVTGEYFTGFWSNVGTEEQLENVSCI